MPNAETKDDQSFQPIYATATYNFLFLDATNVDNFFIINDLILLKNEIRAIKDKSEST